MSYNTARYETPIGGRTHIKIKIADSTCTRMKEVSCRLVPTEILSDTGNDVTILRKSTAAKLGFDARRTPGEWMPVSGISNVPNNFKRFNNLIQIQDLRPVWIPMGIAMEEEHLAEDLLGRAGLLDSGRYEVLFGPGYIEWRERHVTPHTSDDESNELPSSIRENMHPIRNERWEAQKVKTASVYDFIRGY